MDISDIAGLSEPLTRLIEVTSSGIGAVSRPYLVRKMADARAYEIQTISDALRDVANGHELPVVYKDGEIEIWQTPEDGTLILETTTLAERSSLRSDYQERKRQANIESVTSVAATELVDEESVPDEKPDEDWVTRFFNSAQDVSSEQMQHLWGQILAGEIRRPGTYSLRTLDFIRNLSKSDADLLVLVGGLALQSHGTAFVDAHDKTWLEQERKILAKHHFELGELGILYQTDLTLNTFVEPSIEETYFLLGERMVMVKRGEIEAKVAFPIWKFTAIGQELLSLIPSNVDDEYLEQLGQFFVKRKGKAYIASITGRSLNEFSYQIVREITDEQSEIDSNADTTPVAA